MPLRVVEHHAGTGRAALVVDLWRNPVDGPLIGAIGHRCRNGDRLPHAHFVQRPLKDAGHDADGLEVGDVVQLVALGHRRPEDRHAVENDAGKRRFEGEGRQVLGPGRHSFDAGGPHTDGAEALTRRLPLPLGRPQVLLNRHSPFVEAPLAVPFVAGLSQVGHHPAEVRRRHVGQHVSLLHTVARRDLKPLHAPTDERRGVRLLVGTRLHAGRELERRRHGPLGDPRGLDGDLRKLRLREGNRV